MIDETRQIPRCGKCGATHAPHAIVCERCGVVLAAYAPPPGAEPPADASPVVPTPPVPPPPAAVPSRPAIGDPAKTSSPSVEPSDHHSPSRAGVPTNAASDTPPRGPGDVGDARPVSHEQTFNDPATGAGAIDPPSPTAAPPARRDDVEHAVDAPPPEMARPLAIGSTMAETPRPVAIDTPRDDAAPTPAEPSDPPPITAAARVESAPLPVRPSDRWRAQAPWSEPEREDPPWITMVEAPLRRRYPDPAQRAGVLFVSAIATLIFGAVLGLPSLFGFLVTWIVPALLVCRAIQLIIRSSEV